MRRGEFARTKGERRSRQFQSRYQRARRRRVFLERLEERTVLAALLGVDFGPLGDPTPNNWNLASGNGSADFTLTNLQDEAGNTTAIDLEVDFADGTGGVFPTSPQSINVDLLPTHTTPLDDIGGRVFHQTQVIFTFSDLNVAAEYEIYVFAGDATPGAFANNQTVSIVGDQQLPQFQQHTPRIHFVNDQAGDVSKSLASYASTVKPDAAGEIQIIVNETTALESVMVPALAIREVTERLFAVRGTSGQVPTIYELDPATLTQINSFPAPDAVGQIDMVGLAAGPNSLFYVDGTPNTHRPLYELNPDTGEVIDSDGLGGNFEITGLAYLNGVVYLEEQLGGQFLAFNPITDAIQDAVPAQTTQTGSLTGAADQDSLFFISNSGVSRIYKLDPVTGSFSLHATPNPVFETLDGGLAYVDGEFIAAPIRDDGRAYRINATTGQATQVTLPGSGFLAGLAGDGVSSGDAPAAATTSERLYAMRGSTDGIFLEQINTGDGSSISTLELPNVNNGQLSTQGLAVGPDSIFFIDGLSGWNHYLYELDPDTARIIDVDLIDSDGIYNSAAYLDGRVYLHKDPGSILVWDPLTDQVETTLTPNRSYDGLTANPAGELLGSRGAFIDRIDPSNGSILGGFSVGNSSIFGLAFHDGELLASTTDNPARVHRLNPTTGAVLGEFTIPGNPSEVSALGGDGIAPLGTAGITLTLKGTYATHATQITIREASFQSTASATVWRHGGDTTQALTVNLASSDTTEASVPASVTIPAGAIAASFAVTGVDDDILDGTQLVSIEATVAPGQSPSADTFFGASGIVDTGLSLGTFGNDLVEMELLTDGNILVLGRPATGNDDWHLKRFLPDGSIDTTYGSGGTFAFTAPVLQESTPISVFTFPDGSSAVTSLLTFGGNTSEVLTKVTPHGQLDTSFGSDGSTGTAGVLDTSYYTDGLVEPDGSIVVVQQGLQGGGETSIGFLRFSPAGDLLNTSSTITGTSEQRVTSIARQADGKILVGGTDGSDFLVVRYNADGTLDTAFDGDGKATVEHLGTQVKGTANTVDVLPSGEILLAGTVEYSSSSQWALVQLNSDGSLDTSFSDDGKWVKQLTNFPEQLNDIAIQPDGRLLLAGNAGFEDELLMLRLNADGSVDSSFNSGQFLEIPTISDAFVYDTALQRNGKLLIMSGAGSTIEIQRVNAQVELNATAALEVRDYELMTVTIDPAVISENGGTTTATVQVPNTDRGSDVVVTLNVTDDTEASTPATVTIPAGQNTATFTVTGVDDSLFDDTRFTYINSSATGYDSHSSNKLYVLDDDVQPLGLERAVEPLGSLINDSYGLVDKIEIGGEIDRYSVSLDAGQTLAAQVVPTPLFQDDLVARIVIRNPGGSVLLDVQASAANETLLAQLAPVATSGTYQLDVTSVNDTTGRYNFFYWLSTAVEEEPSTGGGNDTFATAQSIEGSFISLGLGGAERGAVLGNADFGTLASEDFESGQLNAQWTANSSDARGRIRVTDAEGAANGSSRALIMDTSSTGTDVLNEATWTVNLAGATDPVLELYRRAFNDDLDALPTSFTGSENGDGASISADGTNWHRIVSHGSSGWFRETVDLAAAVASAGISFDSDFHIKFQQYDNDPIPNDGRGFDELSITGTLPGASDWYKFSLDDGQSASIVLKQFGTTGGVVRLYDDQENLLASSTAGPANVDQAIANFVDSTTDGSADEYYLQVLGPRSDYSLTVTRDATFDLESNSSTGTAQALSANGVALGHIDSSADPDGDFYSVSLAAGQVLRIQTETPFAGSNDPVNTFDPLVVIRNPSGTTVHTADETGNESFEYVVAETGVHTLQVDSQGNTDGEYVLNASLAPMDFADAPDTGAGAGTGNYHTLLSDNGPAHIIVPELFLGASVDADDGTLQNANARADDVDQSLPDDEDGLVLPGFELQLVAGAAATINVTVTNTTGGQATLNGWIDFDNDGRFENEVAAGERVQNIIADGTVSAISTLVFPQVPEGFTGTTYARFRLSTDAAASNESGTALDGEVEDYVVRITNPALPAVRDFATIGSGIGGGPALSDGDRFGADVVSLGDVDGDGVGDIAVTAQRDGTGGDDRGAVYVLLMNSDGTVKTSQKIASGVAGAPVLADNDEFGASLAAIGDIDGDGVMDLAVGAEQEQFSSSRRGAVYIVFLNADGTAKGNTKIASGVGGGPTLDSNDFFGAAVAGIGDLNKDGIPDLAVGSPNYWKDGDSFPTGAFYVLFMNTDGSVAASTLIGSGLGGMPALSFGDDFGGSLAVLGDLDQDGRVSISVGSPKDDLRASNGGAVFNIELNSTGTVNSQFRLPASFNGNPPVSSNDYFGSAIAAVGDLEADGEIEIAVGAPLDDTGGSNRGALYFVSLSTAGTFRGYTKLTDGSPGLPSLGNSSTFGTSLAYLGDLDGDGIGDLAAGRFGAAHPGGAVEILFMQNAGPVLTVEIDSAEISEAGGSSTATVTRYGDLSQPLSVSLASNDTSEATVPASVTILANQASASFTISAVDDSLLDGTETVTITATASDFESGIDTLDVLDHETLTLTIAAASMSENGGTSSATVTRSNTDNSQALVVSLASNDTSEATAPASVTIPANEASVAFTVTAVDDLLDDGSESVVVSASAAGYVNGSDVMDVTDDDVVASLPSVAGLDTVRLSPVNGGAVDYQLTSRPSAPAPLGATPYHLSFVLFAGRSNYQTAGMNQLVQGDDFIPVDTAKTYALSGYARSGDEFGLRFDANNLQSFGFAAFDSAYQPLPAETHYPALDSQPVSGDWTFTRHTGVFGSGTATTLHPDTAFIKPVILANQHGATNNFVQWRSVSVAEVPSGTTSAQLPQPVVDLSTVTDADQRARLTTIGSGDYVAAEQLVAVDTGERYTLSAWAYNVNRYVETPLGFNSFDVDKKLIHPLHVTRYHQAIDTTLAAALNPGDTSFLLDDARGWSNQTGEAAVSRSLSWYGYQDSTGHTYPDYTYTRNVAFDFDNGLWSPGAIRYDTSAGAYRVLLNEPWEGPALPDNSAVRNATTGAVRNDLANTPGYGIETDWQTEFELLRHTATFGGGAWTGGLENNTTFRPGTAFIQPLFHTSPVWTNVTISPVQDIYFEGGVRATFDRQGVDMFPAPEKKLTDHLIPVDETQDYRLSIEAVIGADLDTSTASLNQHSIGFISYDADGNEIMPPEVTNALLDGGAIPDSWTTFSADITSFRAGTAFVRPVISANEDGGAANDAVTVRHLKVERSDLAFETLQRDASNRIAVPIDVLAKDLFGGATTVEIDSVAPARYGTASILAGAGPGGRDVVRYVSPPWFVGTEMVSYTLRNTANGQTATGRVTVEIAGGNDGENATLTSTLIDQGKIFTGNVRPFPSFGVGVNDLYTVPAGQTLTANGMAAHNLTDNDFSIDDIAAWLIEGPTDGELSLDHDGTFLYTPEPGFYGTDSFRYAAFDGLHATEATAVITVLASDEQTVEHRLETIATAMHNYHDTYRKFPLHDNASYFDGSGNPHLSWRVHVLPFLGLQSLYDQFNLDEPWNSTNNLPLLDKMPDAFREAGDAADSTTTRFQLISDEGSEYYLRRDGSGRLIGPSSFDFLDEIEHSILVIQSGPDKTVEWTKPDDLEFDPLDPLAALGDISSGTIRAVTADGSSLTLDSTIAPATFKALVTVAGGEIIDAQQIRREYAQQHGGDGAITSFARSREEDYFAELILGFYNFHDVFARFPVDDFANFYDANGNPHLSWRVHILPFIGHGSLYNEFNLDEPWNSANNLPLIDQMPDLFRSGGDAPDTTTTRMVVFTGSDAAFDRFPNDNKFGERFADFRDGTNNTILFAEVGQDKAVTWTRPDDAPFDINDPFASVGTLTDGRLRTALGDSSRLTLSTDVAEQDLSALITLREGDIADGDTLRERERRRSGQLPSLLGPTNELKELALGMHDYHDTFNRMPVSNSSHFDANGDPTVSWRVLLLPFLGHLNLYDQYAFDEPWDSPTNLAVLEQMPDVFRSNDDPADSTTTRYVSFTGPNSPFLSRSSGDQLGPRLSEISDGTANTIMFVEAGPEAAVPWTKPIDLPFQMNNPFTPLGAIESVFKYVRFDGAAKDESTSITTSKLNALVTHAGGENIFNPPNVPNNPAVTVIESGGDTRLYESGADEIFIVLDKAPASNVEVGLDPLSSGLQVDRASVVFTPQNFHIPQRVVIRYGDNFVADGNKLNRQLFYGVLNDTSDDAYDPLPNDIVLVDVLDDEIQPELTLSVADATIAETDGVAATQGTVTRITADNTDPLTVQLATDATELGLPATVVIPANQTSVTFDIDAVDDSTLDGTVLVVVSATAGGFLAGTDSVDVTDNDVAGYSVSETGGATSVDETGTTDTIEVALPVQPLANVVVLVSSGDTGEVAVGPTTLTFTPTNWNTPQTVTVTGVDDTLLDGETQTVVTFSIDDAQSLDDFDPLSDQTVTVANADHETLSVTIDEAAVLETAGTTTATVTRGNTDNSSALSVTLTSSDTSEATVPTSITIPANESSAAFTITIIDDSELDGAITVTITASAANYEDGTDTLDVLDHETLSVSIDPASISEDGGTATATVTRNNTDISQALTVNFSSDDTSEATVPSSVTIPANEASATFAVTAVDDDLLDGTQTAIITTSATGYVDGTDTIEVTDHETLTLSIAAGSISEDGGTATATVTRNNTDISQPLTVDLSSSDTSAATVFATVTILADEASASFTITAVDDDLLDGTQSVTITSSASGYVGSADTLDVTDHETLTLSISPQSISENGGTATATVTRSNTDNSQPLTVDLSSSDTSEATVPAMVTIPANEASAIFTVTAVDDLILDGTVTVTITSSASEYVDGVATVDVSDLELLSVSISPDSISENGGSTTATVARGNVDNSQALTVDLSSSDTTEATVPASVTILANESTATFTISAVDDMLLDGTQSVTITASASGHVGGVGTLNVTDHETLSVSIDPESISEDGGTATATVTRNNTDISQSLPVNLNSLDTSEASVPASVTIPAGETSATFTIAGVDDSLLDGTQTVTITTSASGYVDGTDTVDVLDHELLGVSFDENSISENGGATSATVFRGNMDTSLPLTFNLTSNDPSRVSMPATVTIPANQALANFTITGVDNTILEGTQTITITPAAPGYVSLSSLLDVTDHETLTLSIDPDSISEDGGSAVATLTRNNSNISPPATVHLSSSDVGEATVPFAVTIAADEASATFTIFGVDDLLLDGTQTVTITGSASVYIDGTATVDVLDHELLSVTIATAVISEDGGTTTATVSRGNTDRSLPLTVDLTSLDTSEATVPAAVTILANEESASFTVTGVDDGLLDGTQTVEIRASASGYVNGSDTVDVTDHEALVVTIDAASISEAGGTTTATVTRDHLDRSLPLTVNLTSLDTSEASVPASVTIPANEASATFSVSGVDDDLLDGTQTVTIEAAAAGHVDGTAMVDVTDHETLSVLIHSDSISEFLGSSTATVTRNNIDRSQALTVTFSSNDTSEATVPAAVTIPANAASAVFTVTGVDDNLLDGTQIVTITASASGYVDASDTIDVIDHETLSLSIDPDSISEDGGLATGTVSRSNVDDVSQALTVDFESDDTTAATVPLTVEIAANQLSATFTIDAVDDLVLDGTQTATITASASGYGDGSDTVAVTDHETLTVTIAADSISEFLGSTTATITRDNTDISQALTVMLTSNDTSEATVPAAVTIPAAETSVTFTITAEDDDLLDGTETVTLTASASGYADGTDTIDVTDHETLTLTIHGNSVLESGGTTAATIARGNTNTEFPLTVTLSVDDASEASVPASVTIPANQASTIFLVTGVDDHLFDGPQTVTVTGSATGYVSSDDSVLIGDHETLTFDIAQDSIAEDGSTTATVTRSDVDDLGLRILVSLEYTDTTEARAPSSVVELDVGEASATFTINGIHDRVVDPDQTITVYASRSGYRFGTDILTITDIDGPVDFGDAPSPYPSSGFLSPDGSLDPSFGVHGQTLAGDGLTIVDMALQDDGKILAVGQNELGSLSARRYNSDGSPDANFGTAGNVNIDGHSFGARVTTLPAGKILLGVSRSGPGPTGFGAMRLNSDGSIDNTFGTDGVVYQNVQVSVHDLQVQPDGSILVAGYQQSATNNDWRIARFTGGGAIDNSFGSGGMILMDFDRPGVVDPDDKLFDLELLPDGRILAAGDSNSIYALAQFMPDGTLDTSYADNGINVFTIEGGGNPFERITDLQLLPDGKVLAASGSSSDATLIRFNSDGSLDTSFDGDGHVEGSSLGRNLDQIELDSQGRIVGLSSAGITVVRYLPDGTPDTTFGSQGERTLWRGGNNSTADVMAIQADGKIVLGGSESSFDWSLLRMDSYFTGAQHTISNLHLGTAIDDETSGQPTANADGDDNTGDPDDEDGVTFVTPLALDRTAELEVVASGAGRLDAWIDYNGDGDWEDPNEQVFTSVQLAAGANTLFLTPPAGTLATSQTFSRFRFSSAGGVGDQWAGGRWRGRGPFAGNSGQPDAVDRRRLDFREQRFDQRHDYKNASQLVPAAHGRSFQQRHHRGDSARVGRDPRERSVRHVYDHRGRRRSVGRHRDRDDHRLRQRLRRRYRFCRRDRP